MLSDFTAAKRRIWLECYISVDDAIGQVFVEVLCDCSRCGLDMRVRIDASGSKSGCSGESAHRLKALSGRFPWRHPWLFPRRNYAVNLPSSTIRLRILGTLISHKSTRGEVPGMPVEAIPVFAS